LRVQPGAELGVCHCQWLVTENIFGYLGKDQGHGGEDQNAGREVRTQKAFRGGANRH
jgi:hypothetical protein